MTHGRRWQSCAEWLYFARHICACFVALLMTPLVASPQGLDSCYQPKFLRKNLFWNQGIEFNRTYTYTLVGGVAGVPADTINGIVAAMNIWTNSNTSSYGSGARFEAAPNNPNADIKIVLRDTNGTYASFNCDNPQGGNVCAGTMANNTTFTGKVQGGTMELAKNMNYIDTVMVVAHEMGHFHGLDDIYETGAINKTIMYASFTLVGPTECDILFTGRLGREKRSDFRADPCHGVLNCIINADARLPFCSWGNAARNGDCFPTWFTEPLKGDVRWRILTNAAPIGGITSPSTVGSSGALTVAAIDPDGKVMRVDWYVNNAFSFTALEDPFELPYANVPPGQYAVKAQVWDDREGTNWTQQVPITIEGSGGGGGGGGSGSAGLLNPWQRLYGAQRLYSQNGNYYVEHQGDGNLVAKTYYDLPYWSSQEFGAPGYTEMDGATGNLVSYNNAAFPYWAANPLHTPGAYLRINNDGSVLLYTPGGSQLCIVSTIPNGGGC